METSGMWHESELLSTVDNITEAKTIKKQVDRALEEPSMQFWYFQNDDLDGVGNNPLQSQADIFKKWKKVTKNIDRDSKGKGK